MKHRRADDADPTLASEILVGNELTDREIEILTWAAKGDTAAQTGERMYLATETIKGYRKIAIAKLGTRSITQAVAWAIGKGIVNISDVMGDEF